MNRNVQSKHRGLVAILAASALGLFVASGLAGCAIQPSTGTDDEGTNAASGTEGSSTTAEPGKASQSAGAHESATSNTNPNQRNANAIPGTGSDPQPSPWSGTNGGQTPGTPVFRQQMNTSVEDHAQ